MSKGEKEVFEITAKKKKTKIILIVVGVILAVLVASFGYSAYKKANETYKMDSETEFIECLEDGFSQKPNIVVVKTYALTKDITITKTDVKNPNMQRYENQIENGFTEEKARVVIPYEYTMTIDGKGHTVKNLSLTGYNASLLGKVSGNVTIKNITFDNLTINGKGSTGAFISYLCENATATFENVKIINSTIICEEDYPVGGLIGQSSKGRLHIKNCSIENSVVKGENATNVGGIVGSVLNAVQENSTVVNCKNINTEVKGLSQVGGIIGEYKDTYVDELGIYGDKTDEEKISFTGLENSGKISATQNGAGGIIGNLSYGNKLNFEFTDCKTGLVNGTATLVQGVNEVGGLIGSVKCNVGGLTVKTGSRVSFQNCENKQMVSGAKNIGGIVGGIDSYCWEVKFADTTNYKDITATSNAGGIVGGIDGKILGGKDFVFTNCQNTASVLGQSYVGGVLGYNKELNPLFENCKNLSENAMIVGKTFVGGISGRYGIFNGCENTMDICDGTQTEYQYIGGIVGSGENSTFTNCSNSGNIIDHTKAKNITAKYIGGIAGYTNQLVLNGCSNSGAVSGSDCVGGFVGKSEANLLSPKNTLVDCTSTGDIYAFGQTSTTVENYTNDEVDDVQGKIGAAIGYFITGTRVIEFSNVKVTANIYILGDTDYVGGWCGYCPQSGGEAIKNSNTNCNISYRIFVGQSVSDICKNNFKYGESAFDERISGFNNPVNGLEEWTNNAE